MRSSRYSPQCSLNMSPGQRRRESRVVYSSFARWRQREVPQKAFQRLFRRGESVRPIEPNRRTLKARGAKRHTRTLIMWSYGLGVRGPEQVIDVRGGAAVCGGCALRHLHPSLVCPSQTLRVDTWSGHDVPRPTARQNMLPGRDSRLSIVAYAYKDHVSMLGLSRYGHNVRQC